MILDKREKAEVDLPTQIDVVFHILNYNQGLVQFADSKANALLLINSIFIASLGPFIAGQSVHVKPLQLALVLIFLGSSIVSILLALSVIMTRKVPLVENKMKTLVYCRDIAKIPTPEGYISEFEHTDARKFRDSTLASTYVVAKIASAKFNTYNYGQMMTLVSCLFWITSMLVFFLG